MRASSADEAEESTARRASAKSVPSSRVPWTGAAAPHAAERASVTGAATATTSASSDFSKASALVRTVIKYSKNPGAKNSATTAPHARPRQRSLEFRGATAFVAADPQSTLTKKLILASFPAVRFLDRDADAEATRATVNGVLDALAPRADRRVHILAERAVLSEAAEGAARRLVDGVDGADGVDGVDGEPAVPPTS